MPNPITHIHITNEVFPNPTPEMLIGSTIPDYIRMAKDFHQLFLRPRDFINTPFAEGIRFHLETDSVFDAQPLKNILVEDITEDLREFGDEQRGTRRALADPGTEILLDGIVLDFPDTGNLLATVKKYVAKHDMIQLTGNVVLGVMMSDYFGNDRYEAYHDAARVALLMHRRLAKIAKPGFLFPEDKIPYVTAAFTEQQQRLGIHANMLLKGTVASLTDLYEPA